MASYINIYGPNVEALCLREYPHLTKRIMQNIYQDNFVNLYHANISVSDIDDAESIESLIQDTRDFLLQNKDFFQSVKFEKGFVEMYLDLLYKGRLKRKTCIIQVDFFDLTFIELLAEMNIALQLTQELGT
jgi:hypothetical protein